MFSDQDEYPDPQTPAEQRFFDWAMREMRAKQNWHARFEACRRETLEIADLRAANRRYAEVLAKTQNELNEVERRRHERRN